jgi:hypothetical protein
MLLSLPLKFHKLQLHHTQQQLTITLIPAPVIKVVASVGSRCHGGWQLRRWRMGALRS